MTKLIKPTVTASSFKKTILLIVGAVVAALLALVLAGERVEIPPAHVGKIMTKDGYQENLIPTSKFRLEQCMTYCDRLVVMDIADKAYSENLNIFIPEDQLNLGVTVQATLSINPKKTEELFKAISPKEENDHLSVIENQRIVAQHIIPDHAYAALNAKDANTLIESQLWQQLMHNIEHQLRKVAYAQT